MLVEGLGVFRSLVQHDQSCHSIFLPVGFCFGRSGPAVALEPLYCFGASVSAARLRWLSYVIRGESVGHAADLFTRPAFSSSYRFRNLNADSRENVLGRLAVLFRIAAWSRPG